MVSPYSMIFSMLLLVTTSSPMASPKTTIPTKLASGWALEDKQICNLPKQLISFMRAIEKFGWEEIKSPETAEDCKDLKEAKKFSKCEWARDKQIASSFLLESISKLPKDNEVKIECCSLFKNDIVRDFFTESQQFILGLSCGDVSFISDS